LHNLEQAITLSIQHCESANYSSFDVFDALNNKFIDNCLKDKTLLRRILIQTNSRLPFNIRPVLGIKKMVHTKAISDLISIYSLMFQKSTEIALNEKANAMFKVLLERKIGVTDAGYGWGLNFPYSTRFVDASAHTPNLYNTINALHSILDFHEIDQSFNVKGIIDNVLNFMMTYLGYVEENDETAWFRYYPGQAYLPTPNVNATVASLFARINYTFKEELIQTSLINKLLNFLKNTQNENGSWYYTTTDKGEWIDGFHTGFILESLALIKKIASNKHFSVDKMLLKGFDYFVDSLFTKNGIPKYYNDRLYPIESQNCAQAMQTLAKMRLYAGINTIELLDRVVENVFHYLYDERGFFYHKQGRLIRNKQFYMRWSQTPMILALINTQKAFVQ